MACAAAFVNSDTDSVRKKLHLEIGAYCTILYAKGFLNDKTFVVADA
jgi:hypothetical protein